MAESAVVIGGAGRVGAGVAAAFRDAGYDVAVVDPAAEPGDGVFAEAAVPAAGWVRRLVPARVVVVSLPARGAGRAAGEFRPAEAAAESFAPRLDALGLAVSLLVDGGVLIELAGGAALGPGDDEAGLVGRLQGHVHRSLAELGRIRTFLCALDTPVRGGTEGPAQWPTARAVGEELVALARSDRAGGRLRLGAPDYRLEDA